MPTSSQWLHYFEGNTRSLLKIPWELGGDLTPDESAAIAGSIKEFQAGESSEGKHLYLYAKDYADRTHDPDYLAAIRLFIAEEQRHGRDLGRFLTLNNIPLLKTTFTDRVFRWMRNVFGNLESSISVLIAAEIIAKVYYAALREATGSAVLRRLCEQILRDESRHVQFQSEQLAKLRAGRGRLGTAVTKGLQRFVYFGAVVVVGIAHRKALRCGGLSFSGWWMASWKEFNAAFSVDCSTESPCSSEVIDTISVDGSQVKMVVPCDRSAPGNAAVSPPALSPASR